MRNRLWALWRSSPLGATVLALVMVVGGLAGLGLDLALPSSANTLTVTNCNDSGPGSLRQAVADASSGDTITFAIYDTCSTITLSSTIQIATSVAIAGSEFGSVAVSGDNAVEDFSVGSGVTAAISRLTVEDGQATTWGGGISNDGTLLLSNSTVEGNSAEEYGGGGIANTGSLTVSNSTVSENSGPAGGGISNVDGSVTIDDSTVSENGVGCCGGAGGIYNDGTMTVTDSTISDNRGIFDGGGIANDGTLTVSNSTVSGNYVGGFPPPNGGDGGAIANYGTLTLSNSTLTGNIAGAYGGGIYEGSGTANVEATILADNSGDCYGIPITDEGYNVDDDGSCGFNSPSISDSTTLDSTLGPLADNGGPTQTIALLPGSPAIGLVTSGSFCPTTDQRGALRTVPCDAGAYDTQPARLPTITTVTPAINPTVVGQPLLFTVAVSGSPAPTGNVTVYADGDSVCSATLALGTGTCATNSLTLGIHAITASYGGDTSYSNSTSSPFIEDVVEPICTSTHTQCIITDTGDTVPTGTFFSFTVQTSGTPSPRITEQGRLPNGVKFYKGSGTATLSGTPISTRHKSAVGTYPITITATFGKGKTKQVVTQDFTLTVT